MPEETFPQNDIEDVREQLSDIIRKELIEVSDLQAIADKFKNVAEKTLRMARDAERK